MADGFRIKDIDKIYQICCQFLGKKITMRKTNYKHKIEKKLFYEYTYLVTILKNLSTNIILSCLLPSKGKVLEHITIQQLDSTY